MKILAFLCFFLSFQSITAQINIDSISDIWNDENVEVNKRFDALDIILQNHLKTKKNDSIFSLAQQGYELAKEKNNKLRMAFLLKTIGSFYSLKSDYNNAIFYNKQSLLIYQNNKEIDSSATILFSLGLNYYKLGKYSKSIENYYQSLKINEEINDKKGIAAVSNAIGVIYHDQGEPEKAIVFYKKSLKVNIELGNLKGIAYSYNNIGIIKINQKKHKVASQYFEKSLKIKQKINDYEGVSNAFTNIANIHFERDEWSEALTYYNKSLNIDEIQNNKLGIATSLINIGNVFFKRKKYNEATRRYIQALKIAKHAEALFEIGEASRALYISYKASGKYLKSLEMHILFINIRDSIINLENHKNILSQSYKYDYEKQLLVDSISSIEQRKVVEVQLGQEKVLRYALVGGIISLSLLAILIISGIVLKKRKEKKIFQINELLESEKLAKTQNELDYKKEQLKTFINNISKNNDLIYKLEQKIEEQNQEIGNKANHLQDLIEMKILTHEDWSEFKSLFMKAYPSLEFQINNAFPDLSNSELRLFMLLKLKRSSQDISSMLGISLNSVKTNRYRLRKKLNLDTKDNLQSLIDNF